MEHSPPQLLHSLGSFADGNPFRLPPSLPSSLLYSFQVYRLWLQFFSGLQTIRVINGVTKSLHSETVALIIPQWNIVFSARAVL